MKTMKRLTAFLLAAIMVLAMSVTAFAETSVSLTVNHLTKGQQVYVYKLMNAEDKGDNNGKTVYNYTLDSNNTAINSAMAKVLFDDASAELTDEKVYNEINGMLNDSAEIKEFARTLIGEIKTNGGTPTNSATAGETGTATISSLTPGYYLIWSPNTVATIETLVQTTETVDMKSNLPTVEKNSNVATDAGAQIGETITFTVKTTLPNISGFDQSEYKFELVDTVSEGLDFITVADGSGNNGKVAVTVKITGKEKNETLYGELSESVAGSQRFDTMTVNLADVVKANQQYEGKEVTITYTAKLNQNAVVDNCNSAEITYSNNPGTNEVTKTVPDKEYVPSYTLMIQKTASDLPESNNLLAEAGFTLYQKYTEEQGCTDPIYVTAKGEGSYSVAEVQESGTAEMKTVAKDLDAMDPLTYNLSLNGLKAGTYYLKETTTPDGYNTIEVKKIVITGKDAAEGDSGNDYTVSVDNTDITDKVVAIENKKGSLLPETGGIGTVIFTAVGVVLIAGVGASFFFGKKKKAN